MDLCDAAAACPLPALLRTCRVRVAPGVRTSQNVGSRFAGDGKVFRPRTFVAIFWGPKPSAAEFLCGLKVVEFRASVGRALGRGALGGDYAAAASSFDPKVPGWSTVVPKSLPLEFYQERRWSNMGRWVEGVGS